MRHHRATGAAVGVVGLSAVLAILAVPPAGAAEGDGLATTSSTRVVKWTDAEQPTRHPDDLAGGPDPRVYESLKDFELRVGQTKDLESQTVQVSWTGAKTDIANTGPLQLMQCWSDGPTDFPTREQCAWGGTGSGLGALTRTPGADPRETTYQPIESLEFATLDGAEFPRVSGIPRAQWDSGQELRVGTSGGSRGACPANAIGHSVIMNTPRGSSGAQLPAVISLVAPTSGLPGPLDVPSPQVFTRSYTHAPDGFRLADIGAAAGVDTQRDDWPLGVYSLQLDCLSQASGGQSLSRYVITIVRDQMTTNGVTRGVWRAPFNNNSEQPSVVVRFDPLGNAEVDAPTSDLDPSAILTYVQPRTTNEITEARSRPSGAGVVTMEMLIDLDAQHLGCGRVEGTRVRSCWLVAVPRFAPEPVVGSAPEAYTPSSSPGPLAQTLWDRRIQVAMEFSPVASGCQIGTGLKQILTNDISRAALRSWQPTFCAGTGTASSVSQPLQDFQIRDSVNAPNRMGVVGVPREGLRTTVIAPVATSSVVVSFLVDRQYTVVNPLYAERNLTKAQELNLNARLLAKLLTQSYDSAAAPNGGRGGPGEFSNGSQSPEGAPFAFSPARNFPAANPRNLYEDPEFLDLNPDFKDWAPQLGVTSWRTMAQLVVAANDTDAYRIVWQWILGDSDASAFLGGDPDPSGMRVNPYYLQQITDTTSTFRVLDPTCADRLVDEFYEDFPLICTFNYASRAETDTAAAVAAVRGDTLQRIAAPGITTVLAAQNRVFGAEPRQGIDNRPFAILALTTASVAERYGLPVARLRNADGNFVAPTESAMSDARAGMQSRSDGVLIPDPVQVGGGGYPLTAMSYAMIDVSQTTPEQNNAFASILDYAAGAGQVVGRAPGQLPPGYAPLTASLQAQTRAAAALLRDPSSLLPAPAVPSPVVTASPSGATPTSAARPPAAIVPPRASSPPAPAAAAPVAAPPAVQQTTTPVAPGISVNSAVARVSTTDVDSPLRWIIPVVVLSGLAAAAGGAALTVAGKRSGAASALIGQRGGA